MDKTLDPARVQRALSQQRIRLLNTTAPGEYLIQGSQDNTWVVHLDAMHAECTCPDHTQRGTVCKHLIFVLNRVLHKPVTGTQTVRELLHDVPAVLPPVSTGECASDVLMRIWRAHPDWQEPRYTVGAECPVCFDVMDATHEYIWWCRRQCGNTVHRECFETCARLGNSRCPLCRAPYNM